MNLGNVVHQNGALLRQRKPWLGFAAGNMSSMEFQDESSWVQPADTLKLSKNAQKRLIKKQKYEATREEWKQKRKEKKRLSRQRKGAAISCEALERKSLDPQPESGEIIIDLAFDSLMSEKEINSLASQIGRCYSINRKAMPPFKLSVIGVGGNLEHRLCTSYPDYKKWEASFSPRSLESVAQESKKLVYLSADSENVIDTIDPEISYIVGGIVDRNRCKGITRKRAESLGIPTAKLPLGDHIKLKSSQILTIVHVYEILCKRRELCGWKEAIESVIPQRKVVIKVDQECSFQDIDSCEHSS